MAVAPLRPPITTGPLHAATRPGARPSTRSDIGRVPAALLLIAVMAVAAALRVLNGAGPSFRLDEGFTVRMAALPLTPVYQGTHIYLHSLFQTVAADVHPPGYILLMHVWMLAFGSSLATIRLPSEIAGVLVVPAVYLLGSSLYSRSVGLVAGLIAALSPFAIWHSQEARMYTFLMLFTTLSSYALVLAAEKRIRWAWALYLVFTVFAIYTQYYAFTIVAAQGLWVLARVRGLGWRTVMALAVTLGLAALTYIPWLLLLRANYHGASNPDLTSANLYTPLVMLSDFLFGYLSTPVTSNVIAAWPLLVPLALAIGTWGRGMSPRAGLLWLLFLLPIVATLLVTYLVRPILSERYLIVALPGLYVLMGVVVAGIRTRLPRLVLLAAVVAVSLAGWRVEEVSAGNPESQDYRAPVQYIESHLRPGDVVGIDAYFNQDAFSYYSHLNVPVYDVPSPNSPTVNVAQLPGYLHGIEAGHSRLWMIYYLETDGDAHNVVRHYLDYHTSGHTVVYGGPFKRNDPHHLDSYRNVQLVLYHLVTMPAQPAQARPETMQELRALTHISPTVRWPFRAAFGTPGSAAPMVGSLLAPPEPAMQWSLPAARADARDTHLLIFNPNASPARVQIASPSGTKTAVAPGYTDLDLDLATWNLSAANEPLRISSPMHITVERTSVVGGVQWFTYANGGATSHGKDTPQTP